MSNTYQMNYKTPVADTWGHVPLATAEGAEDVSSMVERLQAESKSLETYFAELDVELKRVHLKRKIVDKKLAVLSGLVKDVDALHAQPATASQTVELSPQATVTAPAPRRSHKQCVLAVVALVVLALAIAVIALEKTGQLSSCITCAPARLLGLK